MSSLSWFLKVFTFLHFFCLVTYNQCLSGKVKSVIDSTYAFDDVLKAYERIMTGKVVGKIIVDIHHDDE